VSQAGINTVETLLTDDIMDVRIVLKRRSLTSLLQVKVTWRQNMVGFSDHHKFWRTI